ncbi:MAG: SLBB domain-containing protein, partial [Oscillospiraceae bacterium]|nr:SLBB domain-containing protein [Oscillospiraceae bacterium]
TGRIVPEGKLPIDVGCIVINTSTLKTIANYIKTGMPLVEKYVTVDGSAIANPQNVIVPIGASVQDVVDFTGGFKKEPRKIILGGPMMGVAIPGSTESVVKGTGAILCFAEEDAALPEPTACIRCGRCIDACPLKLMPVELHNAYERRDAPALQKLKLNLCMECGCCAFGCPAKIRLVESHKLAKAFLNNYLKEQAAAAERKAAKQAEKEAQTNG